MYQYPCRRKLKLSLVKLSTRHQEELQEQATETAWLKHSLLECSQALHEAIALLRQQDQGSVPQSLYEKSAKFNYENVASACKCSICPPLKIPVADNDSSTSGSTSNANLASNNNQSAAVDISTPLISSDWRARVRAGFNKPDSNSNTSHASSSVASDNGHFSIGDSSLHTNSKDHASLFKYLQRDASGLYALKPPSC